MTDKIQIAIRLDPELYYKLQEYKKTEKLDSMAGAIRRIIATALVP